MARRRTPEAPQQPHSGLPAVPDELLAGCCIEVWATTDERAQAAGSDDPHAATITTVQRWQTACRDWLADHGVDHRDHAQVPTQLRRSTAPWSWRHLAATDLDTLTDTLRRRGLPPDWTPSA